MTRVAQLKWQDTTLIDGPLAYYDGDREEQKEWTADTSIKNMN